MPYLSTLNNNLEEIHYFKKTLKVHYISNDSIMLYVKNSDLKALYDNEKLFLFLPLKNGNLEKIEIPQKY